MCIDDSTTMRMAASPVTESPAVTGCVAVPLFGRIFERAPETSNLENAASKSPNEGKCEIFSQGTSTYTLVPSNQLFCLTGEQINQFASTLIQKTASILIPTIERSIDKAVSRRLSSSLRAAVRRINGTNASGPTSNYKAKQIKMVVEVAADRNTSVFNACKIVIRDTNFKRGYSSSASLYGYCRDHAADIEVKIKGRNAKWNRPMRLRK